MKRGEASTGKKVARKTVEKQRRIHMKTLCFKMASLVPDHHFPLHKELSSQQDQLEHAAAYIEVLRERVDELKRRKTQLSVETKQPTVTVKELGSVVEVVLISWDRTSFRLADLIAIIQQEAAEVFGVFVSNQLEAKTIHTIHAQVKFSRLGVDTERMAARIHNLISPA